MRTERTPAHAVAHAVALGFHFRAPSSPSGVPRTRFGGSLVSEKNPLGDSVNKISRHRLEPVATLDDGLERDRDQNHQQQPGDCTDLLGGGWPLFTELSRAKVFSQTLQDCRV